MTKLNLFKRASRVDEAVGGSHFALLMANIYVTGSGYVHGSYKTLDKFGKWIISSKEEHPLEIMFGASSGIHGVGMVLLTLGRFLHVKFGTPRDSLDSFAVESERVANAALEDFKLHRKRQTQGGTQ